MPWVASETMPNSTIASPVGIVEGCGQVSCAPADPRRWLQLISPGRSRRRVDPMVSM
jgi:hypothetical protein